MRHLCNVNVEHDLVASQRDLLICRANLHVSTNATTAANPPTRNKVPTAFGGDFVPPALRVAVGAVPLGAFVIPAMVVGGAPGGSTGSMIAKITAAIAVTKNCGITMNMLWRP